MYSLTQAGNATALAGLISIVLKNFGINIVSTEIEQAIIAIGIVLSWVGRYRQGDLTLAGFRK